MNTWYLIVSALLSFAGFGIAQHIINLKKKDEAITCPVGFECDAVIRGPYSRFLGISVVNVGAIYYLVLAAFYTASLFFVFPKWMLFAALLLSGIALLMSLYLTGIQLLIIKKWCSWCLLSALINLLIVVVSFSAFASFFVEFMFDFRDLLSWIFVVASLIGALITTLNAVRFIKFLQDFKISKKEYWQLGMYSHTAWVALGFVVLSGIGLVITDSYREITGNSEFLVIGIILGMLVIYEFIHNSIIAPRLIDIHFGDRPELDDEHHSYQRKIAFASIITGTASWYMLLLFSNLAWYEYAPWTLVIMYLVVIIVSVFLSLLVERVMYNKSRHQRIPQEIQKVLDQEE